MAAKEAKRERVIIDSRMQYDTMRTKHMTPARELTVLLIEDDPSWALLVCEMLQSSSDLARLVQSSTMREGLAALGREAVDLVLLDLNLPDSSGLSTLALLRERWPDLPVVVLTDVSGEEHGISSVRMGAEDYLRKSEVQAPLLCRVIRHAVERHHLRHLLDEAKRNREVCLVARFACPLPVADIAQTDTEAGLREKQPEEFARLAHTYRELLERSVEEQIYRTPNLVSARVPELAVDLGRLRSGPRDVMELHMTALNEAMHGRSRPRSQALLEEGRILVLNLMGHLAGYYRLGSRAAAGGRD